MGVTGAPLNREADLIRLAAAGDEAAFEELALAYHGPLFAFFYRSLMNRDDAENLLQETLLRIHRYGGTFDPARPARSWIFGIAANLLKDHRSSSMVRLENPQELPQVASADPSSDPETAVAAAETRRTVARALMELSRKHRMVFVLKHFHGLHYEEIALSVGSTVGTIKSRMHYACRELRRRLLGEGIGEDDR